MIVFLLFVFSQGFAYEGVYIPSFKGADALKADLSDMECLALNIYHEARGESLLGQEYVAQVTINRMRSKRFRENSLCEVVFKRKQFSWTHDGKPDWALDEEAWNVAYMVAIEFYHLKQSVNDPNANQYLWYYNPEYADPDWKDGKKSRKVGNHVFLF